MRWWEEEFRALEGLLHPLVHLMIMAIYSLHTLPATRCIRLGTTTRRRRCLTTTGCGPRNRSRDWIGNFQELLITTQPWNRLGHLNHFSYLKKNWLVNLMIQSSCTKPNEVVIGCLTLWLSSSMLVNFHFCIWNQYIYSHSVFLFCNF